MQDFQAILFDFDGVIVDSEPLHLKAWKEAVRGIRADIPLQMDTGFVGMPDEQIALSIANSLLIPTAAQKLLTAKREIFSTYICRELYMYEDLKYQLCMLNGEKLGIVSSSSCNMVLPALHSFGILDLFDIVVCAEDVVLHKPAPDPYILASDRLGVPVKNCLVVEDSSSGIAAAKAAGMFVIGVTTALQADELRDADGIKSSTSEAVQWMLDQGIFERK